MLIRNYRYTLPFVPTIDQIKTEARAIKFTTRSIKHDAKRTALDLTCHAITPQA